MISVMNLLLLLPILIGWGAAAVAFYGRYRTLPSFLTGPNICRLEAGGCQVLFRTKNAALLGVPNSALGVLYYPLLGAGLFFHLPVGVLFGAATFAFLMTVALAWILLRDKLECRVCWTGHACNTLIWLILLSRLPF
ncbi:MAG TPA: vitamin K epoxide reductase family protein [bacterium]|jgi:uncharacterized membrane protein|nr:vitamin K epoxide reductase family protein [bacterium]